MAPSMNVCCDNETGEIITYEVNNETGEFYVNHPENMLMEAVRRSNANSIVNRKLNIKFPKQGLCNTKKFQILRANIIAGSNPICHHMLVLPTLLLCPAILFLILMIIEVFLHMRCHKKNKNLKDPNMYYRSPFHVITHMFCGVCRDLDTSSKIGQMQDKRRNRNH